MLDLQTTTPTVAVNTTTKGELLTRAKAAIEDGEQSLREAAEALALARDDFNASQREIAAAVGKSVAWVNRLLRWWDECCPGTPFGPSSKAKRERRKRVQAPEQQMRCPSTTDDPEAGAQRRKAEYPKQETEAAAPFVEAQLSTSQKPPPVEAKRNLISAIDQWWPSLDETEKREVIDYFLDKVDAWET